MISCGGTSRVIVRRLILSERSMGVNTNDKGEIVIDRNSKTNIDGAFACGDVVEGEFKQVITGAAQGVAAAYSAYEHITS